MQQAGILTKSEIKELKQLQDILYAVQDTSVDITDTIQDIRSGDTSEYRNMDDFSEDIQYHLEYIHHWSEKAWTVLSDILNETYNPKKDTLDDFELGK